jgi:hypothetical protein
MPTLIAGIFRLEAERAAGESRDIENSVAL